MNEYKEIFSHCQAIIEAATEAVLGEDYYNYCCDSWSCAEMCMEDILYKLPHGKKYVKKYREIMAQKNKELEERYKKEMEKYEFHVGDFVETKDGNVGYISGIDERNTKNNYYSFEIKWNEIKKHYGEFHGNSELLSKYFNRIGQYDFTKPQKQNKIEPLHLCNPADFNDIFMATNRNIENIGNKLNEIIDYINSKED